MGMEEAVSCLGELPPSIALLLCKGHRVLISVPPGSDTGSLRGCALLTDFMLWTSCSSLVEIVNSNLTEICRCDW